jgi:hypothetical protein
VGFTIVHHFQQQIDFVTLYSFFPSSTHLSFASIEQKSKKSKNYIWIGPFSLVKDSIARISGHEYRYRWNPDSKTMDYLGPVGDAPSLSEDQFREAMEGQKPMTTNLKEVQLKGITYQFEHIAEGYDWKQVNVISLGRKGKFSWGGSTRWQPGDTIEEVIQRAKVLRETDMRGDIISYWTGKNEYGFEHYEENTVIVTYFVDGEHSWDASVTWDEGETVGDVIDYAKSVRKELE